MTPSLGCVASFFLSPVQETYICVVGRVIVCVHDQTYLLCRAGHDAAASATLSSLVLAVEKDFFVFSLTEALLKLAFCISQYRVSIRTVRQTWRLLVTCALLNEMKKMRCRWTSSNRSCCPSWCLNLREDYLLCSSTISSHHHKGTPQDYQNVQSPVHRTNLRVTILSTARSQGG